MVQEQLINRLLRAALEERGAQRGLLILSRSGEHRVAALRRSRIGVRFRDEVANESLLVSVAHYDSALKSASIARHIFQ